MRCAGATASAGRPATSGSGASWTTASSATGPAGRIAVPRRYPRGSRRHRASPSAEAEVGAAHASRRAPARQSRGRAAVGELIRPKRRKRKTPPFSAPLAHAKAPNAVWCIDFKGHFAVGSTRCYPLTITDAYSRFLIACVALSRPDGKRVRKLMEQVFDEFGLPDAIRSDNGTPFASSSVAGLSQLSTWWWKLGIRHERIQPGTPQQNGRHERMPSPLRRRPRLRRR